VRPGTKLASKVPLALIDRGEHANDHELELAKRWVIEDLLSLSNGASLTTAWQYRELHLERVGIRMGEFAIAASQDVRVDGMFSRIVDL